MEPSEELVERVARAIAHAVMGKSDNGVGEKWSDWRDEARAAITAMQSEPIPVYKLPDATDEFVTREG